MHSAIFPADTPGSDVDWHSEFDDGDEAESSMEAYQAGWFISYIDILTLLLTLFVILLAMSQPRSSATVLPQHPATQSSVAKKMPHPALSPVKHPHTAIAPRPKQTTLQVDVTTSPSASAASTDVVDARSWSFGIADTELFRNPDNVAMMFPLETLPAVKMPHVEHDVKDKPVTEPVKQQANNTGAPDNSNPWLQQIRHSALGKIIDILEAKDHVDLVISDQVLFAPGKADLKTAGLELLGQLAGMIKDTKLTLSVEGHTDNMPIHNSQFPSNWELSTARATMVTRYLIENKIAPDRIRAIGYADTHPRAQNDSAQGRARNRRVAIVLHLPDTPAPVNVESTLAVSTGG